MNWLVIALLGGVIFVAYALYQAVVSFTWSKAKTDRLRRGPTFSPGESLWMVVLSAALTGLVAFGVVA